MDTFRIGTQFLTRGTHPRLCTVTDILTTRNAAGHVVKVRYVATHELLGQVVTDRDVCATTIAMGVEAIDCREPNGIKRHANT
jgi:hypothetical protein